MLTFDEYLEMALTMHRGCLCPGQVLGTRMALLGCRLLGIDPPDQEKRLFVFSSSSWKWTAASPTPLRRVTCVACGEGVNDGREVYVNGQPLCRACAYGAYYRKESAQRSSTPMAASNSPMAVEALPLGKGAENAVL